MLTPKGVISFTVFSLSVPALIFLLSVWSTNNPPVIHHSHDAAAVVDGQMCLYFTSKGDLVSHGEVSVEAVLNKSLMIHGIGQIDSPVPAEEFTPDYVFILTLTGTLTILILMSVEGIYYMRVITWMITAADSEWSWVNGAGFILTAVGDKFFISGPLGTGPLMYICLLLVKISFLAQYAEKPVMTRYSVLLRYQMVALLVIHAFKKEWAGVITCFVFFVSSFILAADMWFGRWYALRLRIQRLPR